MPTTKSKSQFWFKRVSRSKRGAIKELQKTLLFSSPTALKLQGEKTAKQRLSKQYSDMNKSLMISSISVDFG